jgi:phosphatidylinositol alpha-1,6-mannosyltransferase
MQAASNAIDRNAVEPRRMLLVLPESFNCAGGIQMFCRALSLAAGRWAESTGGILDALVLNDSDASDPRYVNGGFSSYLGAGKSKPKLIGNYLRRLLSSKYDLIILGHVFLSPLVLLARVVNPAAKCVVLAYGVEVWQPLNKIQRFALQHAEAVLAISDYTRDQLAEHQSAPGERIKIFPCTLDPHWQNGSPVAKAQSRYPIILSVTRMNKDDRYKGIDSVIRGLPRVVEEVGPIEYKVIGEGDDVPRLRALAAGLGVSRYVTFAGGMSDTRLREQYQRCSLFVMPSRKEGFGIVFLEAMSFRKAVVGGAHGGTPSVVTDGETGLLVDNSDVPGISRSIIKLLNDKETRDRFGQAGYERLVDQFTFDKFERNFREIVESLAPPRNESSSKKHLQVIDSAGLG